MSTYGQLLANIKDKLVRTDLDAQINDEINRAIEFYSNERFWFNETTGTFSTVANQKAYGSSDSVPTNIREIDSIKITLSSNNFIYPTPETYQEIENMDTTSFAGEPDYYAYFQKKIYFYPIPDEIYTVTLSYQKNYSALSVGSDTNDFTDNANDLIESHVCAIMYEKWIKDYEASDREKTWLTVHLQNLRMKSEKLSGIGRITPTEF